VSFGTFTVQNDIGSGTKNDVFASEQLTLLPAQSNAYGKRTHNFGRRCKLSPCTGTNDMSLA